MTERQAVITDRPGRRTYSLRKPIADRSPIPLRHARLRRHGAHRSSDNADAVIWQTSHKLVLHIMRSSSRMMG
jgi:hypothetical protein